MAQEHKYAQVLRWIADGKAVQFQDSSGTWSTPSLDWVFSEMADCDYTPSRFRIKPRTVKIGNREIEAPVLEPVEGQDLWYWDQGQWEPVKTTGDLALKPCDFTKAGLFFASPEACRAAREAVTALMRGEA